MNRTSNMLRSLSHSWNICAASVPLGETWPGLFLVNQGGSGEANWNDTVKSFRTCATSMHMAHTLYIFWWFWWFPCYFFRLEPPWQRFSMVHSRTVFHGEHMFLRRNLKQIQSLQQLVEQPWWWLPWPWWHGCTRVTGACGWCEGRWKMQIFLVQSNSLNQGISRFETQNHGAGEKRDVLLSSQLHRPKPSSASKDWAETYGISVSKRTA